MLDIKHLSKFVPRSQLAVMMENIGLYRDELARLQSQIKACPMPQMVWGSDPAEIQIYLHYFGGATDLWVYGIEDNLVYGEAFVCLNGDAQNAETGPIRIAELLPIAMLNIDLYWDDATTLEQVMEKVRGQ